MQSLTRRILTEHFPVVRAIKSTEAMNEVLVAGDAVATGKRLRPFRDVFKDWRDVEYWDRLEVRRVPTCRNRPNY
jgi:hypothetical protein